MAVPDNAVASDSSTSAAVAHAAYAWRALTGGAAGDGAVPGAGGGAMAVAYVAPEGGSTELVACKVHHRVYAAAPA